MINFKILLCLLTLNFILWQPNDTFSQFADQQNRNTSELETSAFSTKNLLVIGGLLGTAFILDEDIKHGMSSTQGNFGDNYTDAIDGFGDGNLIIPAQLLTLGVSFVIKNETLSHTTMNSIKALVCSGILAEGMNKVAGRSRPFRNQGSMDFDFMGGTRSSYQSFPSGHSIVAWAAFTPFAEEYSKWIYLIPASVSFSRMYKNKHWMSDVVMGGGLGYLAGLYFHKRKNQKVIFNGQGIVIKF